MHRVQAVYVVCLLPCTLESQMPLPHLAGCLGLSRVALGAMRPQVQAAGIAQASPWVPWGWPPPERAGGRVSKDPGVQMLYCCPLDAREKALGPCLILCSCRAGAPDCNAPEGTQ